MRNFDLTPFWRSTVGFDQLFDLVDDPARWSGEDNYPPYNIERTGEDRYRVSLALAGFHPEQINITAEQSLLTVEGRKAAEAERDFIYRGISARPFRRVFNLAEHVEVTGATFDAGMLQIDLVRELPEKMKPRQIEISAGSTAKKAPELVNKEAA